MEEKDKRYIVTSNTNNPFDRQRAELIEAFLNGPLEKEMEKHFEKVMEDELKKRIFGTKDAKK